jgi:hypothetical protein
MSYTKAILTVIALSLVALAFRPIAIQAPDHPRFYVAGNPY